MGSANRATLLKILLQPDAVLAAINSLRLVSSPATDSIAPPEPCGWSGDIPPHDRIRSRYSGHITQRAAAMLHRIGIIASAMAGLSHHMGRMTLAARAASWSATVMVVTREPASRHMAATH